MVGIDTNVLVRYLIQDDPKQSKRAIELFDSFTITNRGFVSLVVVVETMWVLNSVYKQEMAKIKEAILKLLRSSRLIVQNSNEIEAALTNEVFKGDAADAIIAELGMAFGCEETVTFDKKAAGLTGMRLL